MPLKLSSITVYIFTDATDVNFGKLRDGEGQGSLACCSPRGHKGSDMTG